MKLPHASRALLAASLLLAGAAHAVPAPPFLLDLANSDGSRLKARMLGDEHLSWFEDEAGFALAWDQANGAWHLAALADDGRLVAGPQRAGSIDPAAAGLQRHLRPADFEIARAHEARAAARAPLLAPRKGTVRNLVLLVKFKNQTATWTAPDFEQVFNAETGSVRAYYREVSNGTLDLVSTVVDWIELPENDSYYAYNSARPYGHPEQMIRDAVAVLDARGFDFTQFDADHDGRIDAVDVIHSGSSYETTGDPDYIHSHYSPTIMGGLLTHDGVRIWSYHTEAEFGSDNASITQIGVIAHETAHFFGLPDLYDYGYDSAGLGMWCLMSAGSWAGPRDNGQSPSHPSAWAKQQLGFVVPEPVAGPSAQLRLDPTELAPRAVVLRDGLPSRQYFLLENRQRIGFDSYLPGEGLLVFHVDETRSNNDNQNRYLVDLEQADGQRELNRHPYGSGDATDPFPLPGSDAFTPETTPASLAYGAQNGSIFVTGIAREAQAVRFDVELRAPAAVGAACSSGFACQSGFCADQVCCNQACAGQCVACAAADGASADGLCTPVAARSCDDGNPCTVEDRCLEGVCRGGSAKYCPPLDSCHAAGVCSPDTGRCSAPRLANGTACDDGNPCTQGESCQSGFCSAGAPLTCAPAGECRVAAACDRASGACGSAPAPDGTACSAGTCQDGVCEPKRCGCSATGGGAPAVMLLALLGALRRRRPSAARPPRA